MLGAELVEAVRADLLLALEHELHVARQRIGGTHGLECLHVHERLPLVVVGAAAPDTSILYDGLEGVCLPLLARVDGHDVIVPVDEHRLGLGADDLLGEDHGVAIRRHNLGMVGSSLDQSCGKPLGAALHVGLMLRLGAYRRYAQKFEELFDELVAVTVDILFYLFHRCRVLWLLYSAYTLYLGDEAGRQSIRLLG